MSRKTIMHEAGDMSDDFAVLVRGIGDVGSAVAHLLWAKGHRVAIHDGPEPPRTHRRRMAFTDAWFDGTACLDGIEARRLSDPSNLNVNLQGRDAIPILVGAFEHALNSGAWNVLVDARMRKRAEPEDQRCLAPFVIGLGPGFVAGRNVDRAIETSWGDRLGAVIEDGATLPLAGEPRVIGNIGRERFVYAPAAGAVHGRANIGAPVQVGEVIGDIDGAVILAPLTGNLRGIPRAGVPVTARDKIAEIDPRPPNEADFAGLGERPRRIAMGVLRAITRWQRRSCTSAISVTDP
jgi:xanthine dehydrogenase accessory factor